MFREGLAIFFLGFFYFLADLRICFVKELLGIKTCLILYQVFTHMCH